MACYNARIVFRDIRKGAVALQRDQVIVRTSAIGIGANLALAGFKAAVGLLSGSIAIVLDAVNNLSDALSSVITIIGTKLAGRRPDRDHPFGHGRYEYLSAIIIAVIVLYAGVTSLVESVKKIISPTTPDYAAPGLIIIAVAVLVKLALGRYVKSVGIRVGSSALTDSGRDALLDAVISASTLAAAIIFLVTRVSIEAWLAAVISLIIIRSGVEMIQEAVSVMLGERADPELTRAIKQTIAEFPGVYGAYDLVLHNYGPNTMIGSVHIEVDDTMTADQLDVLERDIAHAVIARHHVIMTGIGVYSRNTRDDRTAQILKDVRRVATSRDYVLQLHAFHADEAEKVIRFDIIVDFAAPDPAAIRDAIKEEIQRAYPDYAVEITLDMDVSE